MSRDQIKISATEQERLERTLAKIHAMFDGSPKEQPTTRSAKRADYQSRRNMATNLMLKGNLKPGAFKDLDEEYRELTGRGWYE